MKINRRSVFRWFPYCALLTIASCADLELEYSESEALNDTTNFMNLSEKKLEVGKDLCDKWIIFRKCVLRDENHATWNNWHKNTEVCQATFTDSRECESQACLDQLIAPRCQQMLNNVKTFDYSIYEKYYDTPNGLTKIMQRVMLGRCNDEEVQQCLTPEEHRQRISARECYEQGLLHASCYDDDVDFLCDSEECDICFEEFLPNRCFDNYRDREN